MVGLKVLKLSSIGVLSLISTSTSCSQSKGYGMRTFQVKPCRRRHISLLQSWRVVLKMDTAIRRVQPQLKAA